ncbi:transcriptional regulator, GntR family [Actinokineospora diospyrosa]|uniref:Transcriptional regulator, GntR family n=1 Tax=Actinokineospora diospyrosa TaxID=103728 RepID=A0ABT1IDQ4_9PSEU|nr:transcriptional regulator, GntR family [Actinokineospora diospyrosa]
MVKSVTPPLHHRVADALRGRISRGQLPVGAALPSEAQLCEEFAASRGTVRQALAALRNEGLIGGGQGKQPVVRQAAVAQPFETFLSFTRWAREMGREPGQRTVEIARRGASQVAADVLGIDEGAPVIEVLRLRLLDGIPTMLERSSFIEPVGRLLFDFDPDAGSIYAHLLDRGIDLRAARHTIDAIGADEVDAKLLTVAVGAPLLRERRRATDASGARVEYADDRYRPDLVTFTIDNVQAGRISPHILKETP